MCQNEFYLNLSSNKMYHLVTISIDMTILYRLKIIIKINDFIKLIINMFYHYKCKL